MTREYKYEVAFSFLQQDEQLAVDIADRIRDRVNTFIYSEHQKEVACRDGMDTFTTVFKEEARVVVVLYRERWGRKGFTRVEKDAIKSRWLESEDQRFLVMVTLDKARAPGWYPSFMIYLDLDRYHIDGAAQLIEGRIQEQGGIIRTESSVEFALRLSRKLDFESTRLGWKLSAQGFADASRALEELLRRVSEIVEQINQAPSRIRAKVTLENESLALFASGYTLTVAWSHEFSNSLDQSRLRVRLFRGRLGPFVSEPPKRLLEKTFDADIDTAQQVGWREREGDRHFYTIDQLADTCLKYLLVQLEQSLDSPSPPPIIRYI